MNTPKLEQASVALETCAYRLGCRVDAAKPENGSVTIGVGFAVEMIEAMNRAREALSPSHTDLMVTPESIDSFMEANPLPPEGSPNPEQAFVLAPSEPTDEMLAPFHGLNRIRDSGTFARRIYMQMIAARPPIPEGDEVEAAARAYSARVGALLGWPDALDRASNPHADNAFRTICDGIKAAIQALDAHRAAKTTAPPAGGEEDHQASHDALHDLVMLRSEEWALNGGGPGIAERWKKAWRAAEEIFEP